MTTSLNKGSMPDRSSWLEIIMVNVEQFFFLIKQLKQTDEHNDRQTDRQTDMWVDRQMGQTGAMIERRPERHTMRCTIRCPDKERWTEEGTYSNTGGRIEGQGHRLTEK